MAFLLAMQKVILSVCLSDSPLLSIPLLPTHFLIRAVARDTESPRSPPMAGQKAVSLKSSLERRLCALGWGSLFIWGFTDFDMTSLSFQKLSGPTGALAEGQGTDLYFWPWSAVYTAHNSSV